MELDLALGDIWVYLSTTPLLHLTLTVLTYLFGDWLFRRSGRKALFNPVLLSILMLVAVIGPAVLAAARVRDHRALGLALGVASHGIGTARAFQIGSLAGAFSALAMGLMALASAFFLPLVLEAAFAR